MGGIGRGAERPSHKRRFGRIGRGAERPSHKRRRLG